MSNYYVLLIYKYVLIKVLDSSQQEKHMVLITLSSIKSLINQQSFIKLFPFVQLSY